MLEVIVSKIFAIKIQTPENNTEKKPGTCPGFFDFSGLRFFQSYKVIWS